MANISTPASGTGTPSAAPEPIPASRDETGVLPSFAPDEREENTAAEGDARPAAVAIPGRSGARPSWFAQQPLRLMLVVVVGVIALFFAFGLLIIFSPTNASVAALAVIATPIATMVAAYYGITLSMQQVRIERAEKDAALQRLAAAERAAHEADVWAAQMESGLRVAKVKLDHARVATIDVEKAAGITADFF